MDQGRSTATERTGQRKYLGWIVAAAIVTFALAGDPTCPSDVDNNATVGTSDLLQVLADWGPCPSASVVATTYNRWRPLRIRRISAIGVGEWPRDLDHVRAV